MHCIGLIYPMIRQVIELVHRQNGTNGTVEQMIEQITMNLPYPITRQVIDQNRPKILNSTLDKTALQCTVLHTRPNHTLDPMVPRPNGTLAQMVP